MELTDNCDKKNIFTSISSIGSCDKLIELAKKNERIVAITASMKDGTGLTQFKEKYPEKPGLLKVDLSIRLWRKIMKLRSFSAESCMKCILAEKRV